MTVVLPADSGESLLLPVISGAIVIGTGIADLIASVVWWPPYFRTGVPVYRARIPVQGASPRGRPAFMATAIDLDGEFDGVVGSQMAFHQLGENEVAFRKQFLQFRWFSYTPTLHGRVHFDAADRMVIVEARVDWAPLGLLLAVIGLAWWSELGVAKLLAAAVGIVGALSLYQLRTYRRIGEYAATHFF
jgi:hypothetical protein